MLDPNGLVLVLLLTVLPAIASWDASAGKSAPLLRVAATRPEASQLVLSVAGEGTVTSTAGARDLNCASSDASACTGGFTAGSDVGTLTAKASVGYTFVGW